MAATRMSCDIPGQISGRLASVSHSVYGTTAKLRMCTSEHHIHRQQRQMYGERQRKPGSLHQMGIRPEHISRDDNNSGIIHNYLYEYTSSIFLQLVTRRIHNQEIF